MRLIAHFNITLMNSNQ